MTQRIALVTGAMGGIGTAVCVELAKAGHKVVAAYHRQFDKPEAWLAEQKAAGFDFIAVAGDATDIASCQAMVAAAEGKAGPVDILVNNAGITRDRMFANMEKDQWDAVINTNLTSMFNMTKQVSAKMAERGWGCSSPPGFLAARSGQRGGSWHGCLRLRAVSHPGAAGGPPSG